MRLPGDGFYWKGRGGCEKARIETSVEAKAEGASVLSPRAQPPVIGDVNVQGLLTPLGSTTRFADPVLPLTLANSACGLGTAKA
jgi:hypothetical protein